MEPSLAGWSRSESVGRFRADVAVWELCRPDEWFRLFEVVPNDGLTGAIHYCCLLTLSACH